MLLGQITRYIHVPKATNGNGPPPSYRALKNSKRYWLSLKLSGGYTLLLVYPRYCPFHQGYCLFLLPGSNDLTVGIEPAVPLYSAHAEKDRRQDDLTHHS